MLAFKFDSIKKASENRVQLPFESNREYSHKNRVFEMEPLSNTNANASNRPQSISETHSHFYEKNVHTPTLTASHSPTHKITGIAPVSLFPHSINDITLLNARTAAVFGEKSHISSSKKSLLQRLSESPRLNQLFDNWIVQEFWFAMNKLSIFGLIAGLMFLGAIFFGVGFLTAYNIYPEQKAPPPPSAWTTANQGAPLEGQNLGIPGNVIGSSSNSSGTYSGGNPIGGIASRTVESQVQSGIFSKLSGVSGVMSALQAKLPAPLQPFAHYANRSVNTQINAAGHTATDFSSQQTKAAFAGPNTLTAQQNPLKPQNIQQPPQSGATPFSQPPSNMPQQPNAAPNGLNPSLQGPPQGQPYTVPQNTQPQIQQGYPPQQSMQSSPYGQAQNASSSPSMTPPSAGAGFGNTQQNSFPPQNRMGQQQPLLPPQQNTSPPLPRPDSYASFLR